ncbi:hypothetical protein P2318_30175 [Myxococcaceae bacterium GXIMD 01537]
MAQPPLPLPEAPRERRLALGLLAIVLGAGALLRVHLALTDDGLYWPDEIFQSLEPAHRLVFGYGLQAWEFIEGARNWALPGLVAALFQGARVLGLDTPPGYLGFTRGAFALLGAATAWAGWKLARAWGASALAASAGASLLALAAVPIYFAPRAMSENASALPVALGLALALRPGASRRALVAGASLLGVAVLLRLQNGIFCVGLLGVLAARRQWRAAAEALAVLAGWALLFGLLDKLTWGRWFHSAIVYLDFNLVQGKAAGWGTAPFSYYGRVLFTGMPWVAGVTAALGLLGLRRAPGLAALAGAFFVLHALQPHKELRFLLPAFPLFTALASVGLEVVLAHVRTPRVRGALALAVVAVGVGSALKAPALTFGDIGQYEDSRPRTSAYDDSGPINRLLTVAGQREDVCGLKVEATHLAWTGGYSYFHREVPLYPHFGPGRESGLYSHVILWGRGAGGGEVVATEGPVSLVRLPGGGCARDSGYTWRLP